MMPRKRGTTFRDNHDSMSEQESNFNQIDEYVENAKGVTA